jgi:hypothetical protein
MSDELTFHTICNIFPLMEGEEFDALVADIKANGLRELIVTFRGQVVDGRNRYRACLKAGVQPKTVPIRDMIPGCWNRPPDINAIRAYVVSKNIHRRHLSAEKRRDLIAELLKAAPEKSDRAIAEQAKASPTTVGKVRATVQGGQLDKRVGKDGKARKKAKTKQDTGLMVPAHEQGPPIELPPPAEGYIREYQHMFEHGTCHLLPETKNYDAPEWQQWRKDHPGEWHWRDRKGHWVDETHSRYLIARDEQGRTIRPGPWHNPDGTPERYRFATPDEAKDLQARLEGNESEPAPTDDLAEKLRAAEIRIVGLESEVEDLKRENAELRRQLKVMEPAA